MPYIDSYKMGSIFQVAYTTDDLEVTIRNYVDTLNVGPWFIAESFEQPLIKYRGMETPGLQTSLAWAYSGTTQYEIVMQNDAGPSVFRDTFESTGHGYHHLAYFTDDFDAERERFVQRGDEIAFEVWTNKDLGGTRVFYADTRKSIGAMTEVGEYCDRIASLFARMHKASIGWDGKNPIRPFSDVF